MSRDAMSSSAWLGLCEDMKREKSEPHHALLYKDGELIAALPAFILTSGMFFDLDRILSRKHLIALKILRVPTAPVMISLFPINFRTGILSRRELSDHETGMLLARFEEEAEKRGIPHCIVLYVAFRQKAFRKTLDARDYKHCYFSSRSFIPTSGFRSFEDYIASIPHKRRSQVRKEIKNFTDSGIRFKWSGTLDIPGEECIKMIDQIFVKYETKNLYTPEFFEEMSERLKGHALWLVAYKKDRPVGWLVSVLNPDALDHYKFSIDYPECEGSDIFLNLMFYEPVRKSIELSMPELNLGISAIQTKALRGAQNDEVYAYIKCIDPLAKAFLPFFMKRKDAYFRANPP